jgi:hypothetical protein
MPGPVGAVVSVLAADAADREVLVAGRWSRTMIKAGTAQQAQASTQASSWRARPSTSSRRRLTAATRSDHHRSLRWIPR